MSGGWLPYHLRSNKAIDRAIFMEFLTKLIKVNITSEYGYIGFGAVHMEDFKLIHTLFNIRKMTSIEMDPSVYERQKFNLPFSCINIEQTTSGDFITDFFSEVNNIIWLDYASPKDLGLQINEIFELLPKLREYDVLKVTLNANPNTLVKYLHRKETLDSLYKRRLKKLQEKANIDYFPQEVEPQLMDDMGLPYVLLQILYLTSLKALEHRSQIFQPVLSFIYKDSGHQMLTLTGIIISEEARKELMLKLDLEDWEFSCLTWDKYQKIDIPTLTIKERLFLDSMMPCEDLDKLFEKVSLQFDETIESSQEKIRNYIKYYRHYPFFSKISV